jgi:HEAT repeat protein
MFAAALLILAQPPAQTPPPQPVPSTIGQPAPPTPKYPDQVAGKNLAGWLKELREATDPGVREAAVRVIPMFGPPARSPSLKPLIAALTRETDPGVRTVIVDTLGIIGADTPDEGKDIAEALGLILINKSGPGSPIRLNVIRGLTNYGTQAASALANILAVKTDPAWETRRAIAHALGRIAYPTDPVRGPATNVLNALSTDYLKDASAAVRVEAAQSLILLGPPGYRPPNPNNPADPGDYAVKVKPYLDAAVSALKVEKDKGAQIWLQFLVMRYDGSQVTESNVRAIANHIAGDDLDARVQALNALVMLQDKAVPAVPAITGLLKSDDPSTRAMAINTLTALGPVAKSALPELERLKTTEKEDQLKKAAEYAADVITGKVKPAVPAAGAPMPPMPPKK